ncbi:MAG: 16S rRNA (cytosine(1402)-N(4))-methyltransferase [Acidobacteria bacterium]|nr:MAG: 16S rRNA (cytosine(1402)-N(4))-methyltransferase [Acidobacteriota bacterium]
MHQPVLSREVIDLLRPRPGGVYVDATLGLGGHSEQIVSLGGRVVGIEWDDDAASRAAERLGPAATIVRESYANLPSILESLKLTVVDGILLDLGVSSLQFDTASRGIQLPARGSSGHANVAAGSEDGEGADPRLWREGLGMDLPGVRRGAASPEDRAGDREGEGGTGERHPGINPGAG